MRISPDLSNVNIRKKLAQLESQDIGDLPGHRERILKRAREGKALTGIKLPWPKTHSRVRLREGECSLWFGINGHCKSTITSQVAVWAAQEERVGIASLEMPLEDTAYLMSQLASGSKEPPESWVASFVDWASERIFIYDRLDSVQPDIMLAAVDYFADALACKLIVVDSLMMSGVSDDLALEREFMATLTGIAKQYHTHIAVVHHVRKPQSGDESYIPSKFDCKGSGALVDLCSSAFVCWKDKERAELLRRLDHGMPASHLSAREEEIIENGCDQKLIVVKQRHAEFEGPINLWTNPSRQFTERKGKTIHLDIPRLAA